MDYTSRMVSLLGRVRKQMNGSILDTLRYYGKDYGLNYGVAIHSLRDIANDIGKDDDFARFLYVQQVRELRIIALWIAESSRIVVSDFPFWAAGIINSEVAEQAAHALLSKIEQLDVLLREWCSSDNVLIAYSAFMAASRADNISIETIVDGVTDAVKTFADSRLIAQGVVAALASKSKSGKMLISTLIDHLEDCPTSRIIRDEMSWRLDV